MAASEEIEIPLRVVMDREKDKVVFAEANSDFVDILFSFLTLPMGTVVRLLGKHSGSIGSFNTLYESITNLDAEYFGTEECKAMLLNPRNSADAQCRKLRLNIDDTKPIEYFICEDWSCILDNYRGYFSTYNTATCNKCKKLFNREIGLWDSNVNQSEGNEGVFVTQTASFAISDDLHVIPNMPSSTLELLNNSGIRDFRVLEQRELKIDFNEILNLFRLTIHSKTPLTDMFLGKKQISISDSVKFEPAPTAPTQETTTPSRKLSVKVLLQKSNYKVLLAECEEDFLFSFLTIPLGRVVSLLSGNISMSSIENFHTSVLNLNVGRYVKSQELKDMLLHPRLGFQYLCSNQIFSLIEATAPKFYCHVDVSSSQFTGYLTFNNGYLDVDPFQYNCNLTLKDPKGEGGYVRGATMYMVTDGLVVTPLSSMSCFTYLNDLKVPPSDVEEQVINIGMDEALNLLKASLKSTSALTNGLNLILKKIKQDK